MKTPLLLIGVLAALFFAVQPVIASSPAIIGEISGVELCPESACNAAVFTGTCDCIVGNRYTVGFFWVAVQREPLLISGQSDIVGGKWNLTTLRGKFSGKVIDGSITNNGDNTFNVIATLRIQKGGKDHMIVSGVLDHSDFPPTFEGELVQP
jgi:hypothetical protein